MTYTSQVDKTTKAKSNQNDQPLIARENFIQLWGFMLIDLKLERTELLVYAVIFAMYKHYCDYFTGSRKYLQSWCNAGKTAVENALSSLEKKKLILKEYRTYGCVRHAVYRINTDMLPKCEMFALENKNSENSEKIKQAERRRSLGLE